MFLLATVYTKDYTLSLHDALPISGTSGSFGGAGDAVADASPLATTSGDPLIAGAGRLAAAVFVGTSGFTAAFPIFGRALSPFPAGPGSAVLALAFVGVAEASEDDATAGSACGCEPASGLDGCWAASFFPAGGVSGFPAGVDGTMDAILSFSMSSYPKSVLILNMLSS